MVKTLNGVIAAVSQDTARIQRAYQQLCTENTARDKALADLTAMVREYGSSPEATRPYGRSQGTIRPHSTIQADVMDGEGNLRAADIGITWEGNETFLHGVRVVGPQFSRPGVKDRSCLHPIHQRTEKTEGTRLRRLNRPHRRHLIRMVGFTDPLQKFARDTDRPHPSKDSTTNPSTGRRGFVISGQWRTSTVGTKTREHYD